MGISFTLTDAEKNFLSRLARMSIEAGLVGKAVDAIPSPAETLDRPQGPLRRHLGACGTISRNTALRGCICSIVGQEPLYVNVWRMAASAAFSDPRFPPLTLAEWRQNVVVDQSVVQIHGDLKPLITDVLIGDVFKPEIDRLWPPMEAMLAESQGQL